MSGMVHEARWPKSGLSPAHKGAIDAVIARAEPSVEISDRTVSAERLAGEIALTLRLLAGVPAGEIAAGLKAQIAAARRADPAMRAARSPLHRLERVAQVLEAAARLQAAVAEWERGA